MKDLRPAPDEVCCPICARAAVTWGPPRMPTRFLEADYDYRACSNCGSLVCHPMPDSKALDAMYSEAYLFDGGGDAGGASAEPLPPAPEILGFLETAPRGTLIDYGCGRGRFLRHASRLGWQACGVEFDPTAAARVSQEVGLPVLTTEEALRLRGTAAAVHLGDVLEHLCDPARAMRESILPLLAPGGRLLAQGPLREFNLFGALLDLKTLLGRRRRGDMPPFHVILASPRGQRDFFSRCGLSENSFRVSETAWPAPSRLPGGRATARDLGLFAARRASQAATALGFGRLGNRFAYIGSLPPDAASPPRA